MPDGYANKLRQAQASRAMQGERRVISLLFCDVTGSTAMAEKLDPEEWAEIMNEAFSYMIAPIYTYEGTVARLMGDAVLAFFGALAFARYDWKGRKLYQKLVKLTKETLDDAFYALPSFGSPPALLDAVGLALSIALEKDIEQYLPLGRKVVEQTEARVFRNEKVEASDKIVSIFEPHTDIIIKDRRGVSAAQEMPHRRR